MSVEVKANDNLLRVSSSPHIRSEETTAKIMWTVNLALMPAVVFSVYHFGLKAFLTIFFAVVTAVMTEFAVEKFMKRPITVKDGSAVVTGLLLAMCLPPDLPVYMTVIGTFIAIAIAKHSMGGLGFNIFNPAHIGRAALMVSWPVAMTTWRKMNSAVDAVTSATPLNILKQQGYDKLIATFGSKTQMYKDMLLGNRNGSLGETCAVLLILGGIYLIYKGYINWFVPVLMIGTVGVVTWVFGPSGYFSGDPIFHMMAGGLIIGAFFMATDMVTIPITAKGKIIFAVGAGLLTSLIRLKGGYPEGVCYAILLMNSITPLVDRFTQPKKFGARG